MFKYIKATKTLHDMLNRENLYLTENVQLGIFEYNSKDKNLGEVDAADYLFLTSKGLEKKIILQSKSNPNNLKSITKEILNPNFWCCFRLTLEYDLSREGIEDIIKQ